VTEIIDGLQLSAEIIQAVAQEALEFQQQWGCQPGLAVVLVGQDPASEVYVRNKIKRAKEAGLHSFHHHLPSDTPQSKLNSLIDRLNRDTAIHGILVQLPLPDHLDAEQVVNRISPEKDVDGFHPLNVGHLTCGRQAMTPCTPLGCMIMLQRVRPDLSGLHAVVIGRSNIVGKPMASLLLQADCTVTTVHSRSRDIARICAQGDILVAAAGIPRLVKANWVKPGATVIDVGINAVNDNGKRRLVGDVDFSQVEPIAGAITPVPGGVGPMTIACLMKNTLLAARRCQELGR
jgi:methylenetetrahydrofolate dehydrogenase (NADP+)/methenyltetrahydrofolate cyclohydrolase